MFKDKKLLKQFIAGSALSLLVIIIVLCCFTNSSTWYKFDIGGELIIFAILIGTALLFGFLIVMLERKLTKEYKEKDPDERDETEELLMQSDEVIDKLEENVWEKFE